MTVLAELLGAVGERARSEPAAVVPVLELLADPDGAAGDGFVSRAEGHTAARRVNAARLATAEERFRAGALDTAQVRRLLGVSRQAVHARVEAGRLLAGRVGSRLVYPGWQFTPTGSVPGLARVLAGLSQLVGDDVRQADAVMRAVQQDMPGTPSLAELVARGRVEEVLHRLVMRAEQS